MNLAKKNVGMGIGVMSGHGILGSMGNISGMPVESTTASNAIGMGLNLSALGMMAKTGMEVAKMPNEKKNLRWGEDLKW